MFGDFNGRVGNRNDFIEGVDEVKPRISCDPTMKKNGDMLLDVLADMKFAILNGRVTPELDRFTSVSTEGMSAIDFRLVGYESVICCKSCQFTAISDYCENLGL